MKSTPNYAQNMAKVCLDILNEIREERLNEILTLHPITPSTPPLPFHG
jgi:hypothetical protein